MKRRTAGSCRWIAGLTLLELLFATSITGVMVGGLLVGAVLIQRSFTASRHYLDAQAAQVRLIDYMSLDLRRALTVSTSENQLSLTIPDFYSSDGEPRTPRIQGSSAVYGSSAPKISYYKAGSTIYREEGGKTTAIASDVADFQLVFTDNGQSISMSVTFEPRFQLSSSHRASVRDGTAAFSTTLLRNKRLN
jgi:type II secretory pathway pseudopilin PulG